MKFRGSISKIWQRYMVWRKAEGVRPPKSPTAPINKLAIDDEDVASTVTANRGNGFAR